MLAERASEDLFQELVAVVSGAESVTVSYKEFPSIELKFLFIGMHLHVHLFCKVVPDPHVVVANKVVQLNAPISQFSQFTEYPDMALRDHLPVFEPKIKNIPYQKNHESILFDLVQETYNLLFPFQAALGIG